MPIPWFLITVPRTTWWPITAEACRANAVIASNLAMIYPIRILCQGQPCLFPYFSHLSSSFFYLFRYFPFSSSKHLLLSVPDILCSVQFLKVGNTSCFSRFFLEINEEIWNRFVFCFPACSSNLNVQNIVYISRGTASSSRFGPQNFSSPDAFPFLTQCSHVHTYV